MTISVVTDLTATPPKNTISVSSGAGTVMSSVVLYRNDPTGKVPTREQPGAGFASQVVTDVECPFGVANSYSWSASYVTPGSTFFTEAWSSLAAWSTSGASWAVSAGALVWSAADSAVASVQHALTSGQYQTTFVAPPTGVATIDFGGFQIDVINSALIVGSVSTTFLPGTGAWTLDVTGLTVTITTTAGAWSATGTVAVAVTHINIVGAVLIPKWTLTFTLPGSKNPQYTAIDASGNVYATDQFSVSITKFNSSGAVVWKVGAAGTGNGQFGSLGPRGVAVDSSGNIWVADPTNNRVQKFNSSGVYQAQFASASAYGIAIDSSGNFYVTDPTNILIRKFNSSGVAGITWSSSDDAYFIAVDSSANVYITNQYLASARKYSSTGTLLLTFGSGLFQIITGIAVLANGSIYVGDYRNNNVQKFNPAGVLQGSFGSVGSDSGFFTGIEGLAVDSSGNLYVADSNNSRIQKFVHPVTSVPALAVTSYSTSPASIAETSAPVTVTSTDGWMIHPITPSKSCRLGFSGSRVSTIRNLGDILNPNNATIHNVLGSATPISTVTGPRGDDQLEVIVSVTTTAEEAAIKAMLADQTPILFNLPPAKNIGLDYAFYFVGDTTRSRFGQMPNLPFKSYVMPLTKVQSPIASVIVSGWSWAALLLAFPDWNTLKLAFNTWADVKANNRNPGY